MPVTEEGTKRLFDFLFSGMLRASEFLGNPHVFLRTVVEASLRRHMADYVRFHASDNATETCAEFTKGLDRSGIVDASDSVFRGDANRVDVEIGDRCPARRVCTARHDEGLPVHCLRAYVLAEMLRIRLDEDFDWKLNRFGRPCKATITRSSWGKS